jgi:hypothetical protein
MHGALKGFGTKPVIRDAKVKSVSAIEVEAVYNTPRSAAGVIVDSDDQL